MFLGQMIEINEKVVFWNFIKILNTNKFKRSWLIKTTDLSFKAFLDNMFNKIWAFAEKWSYFYTLLYKQNWHDCFTCQIGTDSRAKRRKLTWSLLSSPRTQQPSWMKTWSSSIVLWTLGVPRSTSWRSTGTRTMSSLIS